MLKMQGEAKKRITEMQNRSRFAAEQMNRELHGNDGPFLQTSPSAEIRKQAPVETAVGKISSHNADDTERMFILSLCMLLSSEGADEALIVALMYLLT